MFATRLRSGVAVLPSSQVRDSPGTPACTASPYSRDAPSFRRVAEKGPPVTARPELEPDVDDTAPTASELTDYDRRHLITYLRLLDANDDPTATWEEACLLVLHIDPVIEPARARRAYDTHFARAKWMTESGYANLLRETRLH